MSNTISYWDKRWASGKTSWHLSVPNDGLVNHHDKVALGRKGLKFLVPLCGKTLDMAWLYGKGQSVIGVEGVLRIATEFFIDNDIEYNITNVTTGPLLQSTGGSIRIYVGDFFQMSSETIGHVDCIWDRASLVTVTKADRNSYVSLMKTFMNRKTRYLLQTVEYDADASLDISPRSISYDDVCQLYGDKCHVELLETVVRHPKEFHQLGIFAASKLVSNNILLTCK